MHTVINTYSLSTVKDPNISRAVCDILSKHDTIPRDHATRKMLGCQLRKAISYRKYYNKKRSDTFFIITISEDKIFEVLSILVYLKFLINYIDSILKKDQHQFF